MPPRPSSSSSTKRSFTTLPAPSVGAPATARPTSVQLERVRRDPVGVLLSVNGPVSVGGPVTPAGGAAAGGAETGAAGAAALGEAAGALAEGAALAARGGRKCVFSPSAAGAGAGAAAAGGAAG